ncbi:UDP-2,3-diacylglucosamine diphosphatase [Noviherbaspirillum saxi]|uniref:UDP-2,3-diacylglucosamine hydrolase n=1 Tax=Noviherbaspirillum saxi TaxID=2320863 RepID=A0A3A3GCU7_9BURK|nr:UDP-2,3-diacylglucosamine diphosphatase [Noviherbaspirillum saxi]RJF98709.1 UDP-2,3-diacylglucosamine diphosphatase [Noviherbaspirillum saxi]
MTITSNKAQSNPVALFVSDVHLQASLPRTTEAFLRFLDRHAIAAQQLYVLGDLFEYWAGDDDLDTPYHRKIVEAIRVVHDKGVAVYWVGGNRDFLIGSRFAEAAGMTILDEPFVTQIAEQRVVLLHGDAQCTDDKAYMDFRRMVRAQEWQHQFLAMPLAQRKTIIDSMRTGSRDAQRNKAYEIMDVNSAAIDAVFESTQASLMIHGHTHRPASHMHVVGGTQRIRHVLPDWDCDAEPSRGGWIGLYPDGSAQRFGVDGQPL